MIYRGDNGIKLIFTVNDNNGDFIDLSKSFIDFQMVSGNTRVKKRCTITRDVKGQCFCVLTSIDTQVPGSYRYQLTVNEGDSKFSSSSGKLKILNKV